MSTVVSVVIVTYNSSKFIIETLDSVYNLTWKDIELIITDDCSTDETVELCETWLRQKSERFFRTCMVTSEVNTGVSANGNRGLGKVTSKWVKLLGGDDVLVPGCLTYNMEHVSANPDIRVLFSQLEVFRDTFEAHNYDHSTPEEVGSDSILWSQRSVDSQYRMLLKTDRIHFSPSVFIHMDALVSVDCFDERFRDFEDYTLWLNLTRKGHRLYFMKKVTVKYRMHAQALNNTGISQIVNPNYYKEEGMRKLYTYPYLPLDLKLEARHIWFVAQLFRLKELNKRTKLNLFLWTLLRRYLNPFSYYIAIKKRLNPKLMENELYL